MKHKHNFIDLTGKKFGRLTVLKIKEKNKHMGYYWLCKCECGNTKQIRGSSLRDGHTQSCGCLQKEIATKRGKANKTHGLRNSREYNTWNGMKERCLNKKHPKYKNYGGRSIMICDRWLNSFENFFADMGMRPNNRSIDRINNDKGYSKRNCRWATDKEQANNRRGNLKNK